MRMSRFSAWTALRKFEPNPTTSPMIAASAPTGDLPTTWDGSRKTESRNRRSFDGETSTKVSLWTCIHFTGGLGWSYGKHISKISSSVGLVTRDTTDLEIDRVGTPRHQLTTTTRIPP